MNSFSDFHLFHSPKSCPSVSTNGAFVKEIVIEQSTAIPDHRYETCDFGSGHRDTHGVVNRIRDVVLAKPLA
jgi:hypothetical protein